MDKIKGQANKVGELLFASETGAAYQRTLTLTWDILRETGVLLWLVICLVFVGGEWFWKSSVSLGKRTRDWYEGLSQPSDEEPKTMSDLGQSTLSAFTFSAENLLYQAKKQLDIDAEPPAPRTPAPKKQITTTSSPESSVLSSVSAESETPAMPLADPSELDMPETPPVQSAPPTVVATYNSPEATKAPGTKTALASMANQAQKDDKADDESK